MKKSIVLLISLLFISAISVLILKNLKDTSSYIKEQNYKINKIQLISLLENAQSEATKIIKKHNKDVPAFENVSLDIEGFKLTFSLLEYDKQDVNLLKEESALKYKEIEDLFIEHNIDDFENFRYLFKGNNKITNNKQVDDIIRTFIKETYNDKILDIKDKLGFYSTINNSKSYELILKVENIKDFIMAYYILDNKGEVKYFELSFK